MSDLNYLLDTTDAMVWAEAFCNQFNGKQITSKDSAYGADPALMIGWFASAMAAQEAKMNRPLVDKFLKNLEEGSATSELAPGVALIVNQHVTRKLECAFEVVSIDRTSVTLKTGTNLSRCQKGDKLMIAIDLDRING